MTIMRRKDDEMKVDDNPLGREKLKQRQHDLRLSYTMTSQARLANGHLFFVPDDAPKEGTGFKDVPIPNFSRCEFALIRSQTVTACASGFNYYRCIHF